MVYEETAANNLGLPHGAVNAAGLEIAVFFLMRRKSRSAARENLTFCEVWTARISPAKKRAQHGSMRIKREFARCQSSAT
jgi:hypothetical protein